MDCSPTPRPTPTVHTGCGSLGLTPLPVMLPHTWPAVMCRPLYMRRGVRRMCRALQAGRGPACRSVARRLGPYTIPAVVHDAAGWGLREEAPWDAHVHSGYLEDVSPEAPWDVHVQAGCNKMYQKPSDVPSMTDIAGGWRWPRAAVARQAGSHRCPPTNAATTPPAPHGGPFSGGAAVLACEARQLPSGSW
jgi:hypothetical protein